MMGISAPTVQVQNPGLHGYILGGKYLFPRCIQPLTTFGRRKLGLTNSLISGTTEFTYIWYPVADSLIQGNIFQNAQTLSTGTSGSVKVTISNNLFVSWSGGGETNAAVENWASYGTSSTVVSANSFLDTNATALALPDGYTSTKLSATGNYFNTSDPNVISNMVFDKSDDLNSGNYIQTAPALTVPDASTPSCFSLTQPATGVSTTDNGSSYSGPVSYLQRQFIFSGNGSVAINASVANAFVHGGASDDAIAVTAGSNVLDGGTGSNFLVGGSGADGGVDTFFVDGRGGGVTWSTVVDFHHGDQLTIWGFVPNQSTQQWVDRDGAAGYQGLTLHSELGGTGTGVNASATLAGLSTSDIQKLTITTGTVSGNPYMLIQFTG
jgi:serralysin